MARSPANVVTCRALSVIIVNVKWQVQVFEVVASWAMHIIKCLIKSFSEIHILKNSHKLVSITLTNIRCIFSSTDSTKTANHPDTAEKLLIGTLRINTHTQTHTHTHTHTHKHIL